MTTTPNSVFATGEVVGTGAAINVSVGWVPRRVEVYNVTDGDTVTICFLQRRIPFTSGGTATIAAGDKIIGATSGATARINEVILVSGTWAGGDAAGTFLVEPEDIVGTFTSENVYITSSGTTNDATVTVQVSCGYDIDTEVAAVTNMTTTCCVPYLGSSTAGKGFSIGTTTSESGKVLRWSAWR